MIIDDFAFETGATAVDASQHWQLAPTSSSGLTFHGAPGNVQIDGGSGDYRVLNLIQPDRANQRAEISFYYDTITYPSLVSSYHPGGYWRLGETTGTIAVDSSGFGQTGTYVGGVTLNQTGSISGDSDKAVLFNGTTGFVDLGRAPQLSTISACTLKCSFKFTAGGVTQVIFTTGDTGGTGFALHLDTANKLRGIICGSANLLSSALSTGTWYYAVFTFDGTTARLYLNGALITSATGTAVEPTTSLKSIGCDANMAGRFFTGYIDEVEFYPYALTGNQVAAMYAASTGGSIASVDNVSVFLRYIDQNNYIRCLAHHTGTKGAELVEVIAGVSTTLITLAYVGPATGYGALRLELIGRRARMWYESAARQVRDRPPDSACNLGKDYDTEAQYDWGIGMQANGATGMAISRFYACGLPLAILPPPYTQVLTPSGYNFVPVTLTVSGLGSAAQIEWQVLQVEPADFPEPHSAITVGTMTSYTLFLRTGYDYDVRARAINGDPGPWSPYTRIGAVGTPGGSHWTSKPWLTTNWPEQAYGLPTDTSIKLAPDNFPDVIPDWVLESSDAAEAGASVGSTGVERMMTTQPRPRRGFKLVFANREKATYQLLIKFFDYMKGRGKPFNWTHVRTAEQFVLRFTEDQYQIDYVAQNVNSPVASLSFNVTESPVGVVPTYAPRLRASATI